MERSKSGRITFENFKGGLKIVLAYTDIAIETLRFKLTGGNGFFYNNKNWLNLIQQAKDTYGQILDGYLNESSSRSLFECEAVMVPLLRNLSELERVIQLGNNEMALTTLIAYSNHLAQLIQVPYENWTATFLNTHIFCKQDATYTVFANTKRQQTLI
jgi:hypothetical protein